MKLIVKIETPINANVFEIPEWKFINGNFPNRILLTIKNETEKIIGNNSLGWEYSGLLNLIFSMNKTRVAIVRAFIGVGKPIKYGLGDSS